MALGKNIKKDKLIPSKPKKEELEIPDEKIKSSTKKKTTSSSAKVTTKNASSKKKAVKKVAPKKVSVKKASVKKTNLPKPKKEQIAEPISAEPQNEKTSTEVEKVVPFEGLPVVEKPVVNVTPQIPAQRYRTAAEVEERRRLKEYQDLQILKLRGTEVQLIVFSLGGERYALEIDNVKEIVPSPRVSQLPHAPEFVKGVANIRGFVMVILDLEQKFRLFGKGGDVSGNKAYTMVIKNDRFRVGLLVNEVPNTLKLDGDQILSSAGIMNNTVLDETYIKGLINQGEEMIILLDMVELMEAEDVGIIAQEVEENN